MAEPARPLPTGDDDAVFVAAVEEGIADLDAGHIVPYEAVRHWLLSWGTETELPPLPCT